MRIVQRALLWHSDIFLFGKRKLPDKYRSIRKVAIVLVIQKALPLDLEVWNSGNGASPTIQTVRSDGAPMKIHSRNPIGRTKSPSIVKKGPRERSFARLRFSGAP